MFEGYDKVPLLKDLKEKKESHLKQVELSYLMVNIGIQVVNLNTMLDV